MDSSSTLTPRTTGIIWTFLFASALIRCWLMPLRSGFWLDETGTYYIISGNWHQFLERMSVAIQSPLYCGMLWLVYHGVGSSELILRTPSILAMALAAFLLYRLTARFVYPAAGLTATLIFIAMPDIGHLAYQARPYSLSIAVLLASILYFWRWLDKRRRLDGALCIVFLAAAFYSHPTYGLMGFVYALVIAREALSERTLAWKQIALGAVSLAILCFPVLPYYRSAAGRASTYSFAETPGWANVFGFFPGIGGGALLFGVALLYLIFPSVEWRVLPVSRRAGLMVTTWLTLPPGILAVVAKFTPAKLFVLRYYAYILPAVALVFAMFVCCVKHSHQRMTLVSVVALGLVIATWSSTLWPSVEVDWRETAGILRQQAYAPDAPIFVKSGFIEAKSLQWFNDEVRLGFLLAPIHMYPIPGAMVALPYEPGAGFDGYMANAVRGLASRDEFFVVDTNNSDSWQQWFRLRYASTFQAETLPSRRGAPITRFRRAISPGTRQSILPEL